MDTDRVEVVHGLTEGECGILILLGIFGPQESHFFIKESISMLVERGFATFDTKENLGFTITKSGKKIFKDVKAYRDDKIKNRVADLATYKEARQKLKTMMDQVGVSAEDLELLRREDLDDDKE